MTASIACVPFCVYCDCKILLNFFVLLIILFANINFVLVFKSVSNKWIVQIVVIRCIPAAVSNAMFSDIGHIWRDAPCSHSRLAIFDVN